MSSRVLSVVCAAVLLVRLAPDAAPAWRRLEVALRPLVAAWIQLLPAALAGGLLGRPFFYVSFLFFGVVKTLTRLLTQKLALTPRHAALVNDLVASAVHNVGVALLWGNLEGQAGMDVTSGYFAADVAWERSLASALHHGVSLVSNEMRARYPQAPAENLWTAVRWLEAGTFPGQLLRIAQGSTYAAFATQLVGMVVSRLVAYPLLLGYIWRDLRPFPLLRAWQLLALVGLATANGQTTAQLARILLNFGRRSYEQKD